MHFYRNVGKDEYMKEEEPIHEDKPEHDMEIQNPVVGPESGMINVFLISLNKILSSTLIFNF